MCFWDFENALDATLLTFLFGISRKLLVLRSYLSPRNSKSPKHLLHDPFLDLTCHTYSQDSACRFSADILQHGSKVLRNDDPGHYFSQQNHAFFIYTYFGLRLLLPFWCKRGGVLVRGWCAEKENRGKGGSVQGK